MRKYLLLSLVLAVLAMAFTPQEKYTLTGQVLDDQGIPVVGASVMIKSTPVGVAVDVNGNFKLTVSGNQKLVVSAVGFVNQEIKIKNQKTLKIVLKKAETTLEEVVVVGYGTEKKTAYTGSEATISSGYIPPKQVTPVTRAIEGVAPGVMATNGGGAPGSSSNVVLRGYSSVSSNQGWAGAAPATRASGGFDFKSSAQLYGARSGGKADSTKRSEDVDWNTEGYDQIVENPFIKAKGNPLSTFSIDVDAASYSNIRRFLDAGQLPPKGAVRIEEMINYFTYQYPQPTNDDPFSVNTEVSSCPWNPSHQLVLVGLQGKKIESKDLPPSNLVFLIDVSGSMWDERKLPLVKSSLKLLVDQLRPQDKVAMVVYAGNAGLVLPSTAGDQKMTIKAAIEKLEAGGSTAGGAGIQLAYKTAKDNFMKDGNNRVILCTDGDFNVGVSSDDGLISLVEEERKSGVFLTVLGYGMGNYQDAKMQKLADKGNGNHAYIDNIKEANKVLVKEAGGTLYTIAKDVKLQIEFNPTKVQGYRLIGYENRMLAKEDFNDDTKDAGELGSGHTVTALYEIIPLGVEAKELKDVDDLRYQQPVEAFSENPFNDELMFVKLRYKKPDSDISKLLAYSLQDGSVSINNTSENFRFAAAVAGFGLLLRDSKFKGTITAQQIHDLADKALGKDGEGYRKEFIQMVDKAKAIQEGLGVKR